jgi:hypothetical protein
MSAVTARCGMRARSSAGALDTRHRMSWVTFERFAQVRAWGSGQARPALASLSFAKWSMSNRLTEVRDLSLQY